jgi:hypothetical protein
MNSGHEQTACEDCHRDAPGTLRQQLQANARYLLGRREAPVEFGKLPVGNQDCLACHERPFDRHPVFRFNEPRFSEARKALSPQLCASCHREHSGQRVTAQAGYCAECHADIDLSEDPVRPTHAQLSADGLWATCLGCHDFHGNHSFDPPTEFDARIDAREIEAYLKGGPSPYPLPVRAPAKTERTSDDNEGAR